MRGQANPSRKPASVVLSPKAAGGFDVNLGAQVKTPDPTACSCSFSSATSTWVCSYNGACGDHMYETMD